MATLKDWIAIQSGPAPELPESARQLLLELCPDIRWVYGEGGLELDPVGDNEAVARLRAEELARGGDDKLTRIAEAEQMVALCFLHYVDHFMEIGKDHRSRWFLQQCSQCGIPHMNRATDGDSYCSKSCGNTASKNRSSAE